MISSNRRKRFEEQMTKKNPLLANPPYAVEQTLARLGTNLRTARVRRKLTIQEMAEKIGTGPRAVSDAEKGKPSTGIAVYMALLWALGLLDQIEDVADPAKDKEGQTLALSRERTRARQSGEIDNDF
jgi:transcriptional regulator with XRE-family HTH domain